MADSGKKFPMGLIVGMIVFGLLLAGGVSYFIATKIVAEKSTGAAASGPGVLVKLGDAKDGLLVNIGGVNSGRYLKIGIILEMQAAGAEQATDGKSPSATEVKVLDTVVQLLRSQKIEDFDPGKQDQLKEIIKNELNKTLGAERVYQVYITHFILQ
ncbi:flagellar basal body-associated FliL family protein|uniref:Flagellar protein FliL n=1 Tax=Dendrosporobacter quercicolus TaxID=146817 RepID=A0A1G9MJN3_9FIRM|nr:flagellar basal body-associated FliL family protein [Dendrosporobacter quercicolus]NSL47053.1 flagellar basal body-associated FliL family protein [Dendrosporobacter quercicolus DSM 1736]SDL74211.1 flagellar FliL protein [Dendrosporobacter quercicolus]